LKENFDRFNFEIHKEKEMVDFRRFITALAVLAVFAGLAAAQGTGGQTQLTCSTNVTATPQLRAEGYTEATGDITITCTGGPTPVLGAAIPLVNITVFLNTQVTSRLLGSSNQSEALLLIDEPGSLTLPSAVGSLPFGPNAPQSVCPNFSGNPPCTEFVSTAAGAGTFAGQQVAVATNAALGANITSGNGYNVFQGVVGSNSVTWFGVPVMAPGTTGITRTFRFTNIRANASALSGGSASGATPVIASIAVSNTAALPITNPTPTVGFVQQGLSTAASSSLSVQQCVSKTRLFTSTVTFTENFGTAFKTRVVAATNALNAAQSYSAGNVGVGGQQNIPGTVYNSESNFIQPTVTGNGWTAGLADFGTRLKATFNNIPTGMRLFVSVNNVKNGNAGVTTLANPLGDTEIVSSAQLVNSETALDGNANGGFFPAVSASDNATDSSGNRNIGIAELAITNGSATAVWEVVNTNPNATESFRFGVFTTFTANVAQNSPPAGTATVNLSYAPTPPAFTASSGSTASGSLNIPRFIQDPNAAKNIFIVNVCRTILLYPFVTNQSGFDTGLAIANTSTDPFGTGPQAGSCTLNWYSGPNSPASTNTGSIASGTVYTALASVTVPGFQGYMIAVCQFQYAHGFAFISDLGARNLAMGYLALIIPDPAGQNNGVRNASSSGCGVGDINCNLGEMDAH